MCTAVSGRNVNKALPWYHCVFKFILLYSLEWHAYNLVMWSIRKLSLKMQVKTTHTNLLYIQLKTKSLLDTLYICMYQVEKFLT